MNLIRDLFSKLRRKKPTLDVPPVIAPVKYQSKLKEPESKPQPKKKSGRSGKLGRHQNFGTFSPLKPL